MSGVRESFDPVLVRRLLVEFLARLRVQLRERDLLLLDSRVLPSPPLLTQVALAARLGVSHQRVAQIEAALVGRLRAEVQRPAMAAVAEAAAKVGSVLGVALPATSPTVVAALEGLAGPGGGPALSFPVVRLLLVLAGPYMLDDDWLILTPEALSLARRQRRVRKAAVRVPLPWAAVVEEAAAAGIAEEHVPAWVSRIGLEVTERGVARRRPVPSLPDRCEHILRARGAPMTFEGLADELGEGHSVELLRRRVLPDARFTRSGISTVGLREWGTTPYISATAAVADAVRRSGGALSFDALDEVAIPLGLSPATLRKVAGAPIFVTSAGTIRFRGPEDPPTAPPRLEASASCYLLDGRWTTRVAVNGDVLRGSGRTIPAAFAHHLGVEPGRRHIFATPLGSLTLVWERTSVNGPHVTGLRDVAAPLGAQLGDYLFLADAGDAALDVRLLAKSVVAAASPMQRLRLLVGQPAGVGTQPDPTTVIAASLGLPAGGVDDPTLRPAVLSALRARREFRLARLLAGQPGPHREWLT